MNVKLIYFANLIVLIKMTAWLVPGRGMDCVDETGTFIIVSTKRGVDKTGVDETSRSRVILYMCN